MADQSSSRARKNHQIDLTQGPILPVLVSFSLPVLGANVLQSINGSVNALWVGRLLGEHALTATTNANLILFFLMGSVFGVGMAATILVGQAVGARNLAMAKRVVGTSAAFFLGASVLVAVFGLIFTPQVLGWMGTPDDVRPMAESYLRIIFAAMPFLFGFAFLMMVQRGAGDARTPFIFMGVAAALDIALNPLFIVGAGPLPRMGIAGAAMATLISQALSLLALVVYLYRFRADIMLQANELRYLKPDRQLLSAIVLKGLPMGAQMAVISLAALIMMSMINAYGAETAAVYGVMMQIWTFVQMPAMAIGAAVSTMAAQNVGANKWDRVERTAFFGSWINVTLTGAVVLVLLLVDPYIVDMFLPGQPEAVALAEHINLIAGWSFVLFGITFVLFGVVRSTGAVMPPLLILLVSLFGVRLTFAHFGRAYWGQDAIWFSLPVSMIVAVALAIAYYRWGGWRNARMLKAPAREVEDAPETGVGAPALDARVARGDESDLS